MKSATFILLVSLLAAPAAARAVFGVGDVVYDPANTTQTINVLRQAQQEFDRLGTLLGVSTRQFDQLVRLSTAVGKAGIDGPCGHDPRRSSRRPSGRVPGLETPTSAPFRHERAPRRLSRDAGRPVDPGDRESPSLPADHPRRAGDLPRRRKLRASRPRDRLRPVVRRPLAGGPAQPGRRRPSTSRTCSASRLAGRARDEPGQPGGAGRRKPGGGRRRPVGRDRPRRPARPGPAERRTRTRSCSRPRPRPPMPARTRSAPRRPRPGSSRTSGTGSGNADELRLDAR